MLWVGTKGCRVPSHSEWKFLFRSTHQTPLLPWLCWCSVWKSGHLWPEAGGRRWRLRQLTEVKGLKSPGVLQLQAHPLPPPRVTSRSGASGQGPAESVFRPGYFVKYHSELTKVVKLMKWNENTAVRLTLVQHNELCFSYLADIAH